jgi:tetratricopeptide (TPR) repeat protein
MMPTLLRALRPLATAMVIVATGAGAASAEEWGELHNRAVDAMKAKDFPKAEADIIAAIGEAADFPADDERMLQSLVILADIYRQTRQWAAAAQQLETVLEAYGRRGINQSQEASNLYNKLGVIYVQMNYYDKALPALEMSLAIKRKKYKQNAASIAIVVTNLAELYRRKGDWAKAEALHLEAISDKELELGPEHPTLIASLNDLALVFRDEKKLDEALPYLERAMSLARKGTHEGHKAELATTLHNMAEIRSGKGEKDDAFKLYEEALAIRKAELGPDHPHVGETLNSFANLLLSMNKGEEALGLYDEAIRIRKTEFGSSDNRTLSVMTNKAMALDRIGRKDEAEALRAEVRTLREKR